MALTKLTDIRKSLSVEAEDLQVNGITTFTGNVSIGGTLTYQDVTNIDSVGLVTAREGIFLPDEKKVEFGNAAGSGDLQIYHSPSNSNNSFIKHTGAGALKIAADHFRFRNAADNTNLLNGLSGDAVALYFAGNEKLKTTTDGIEVPDAIRHTNDTDTKIRFPADNTFTVETGGNERLRIASGGQVIIGDDDTDKANGHFDDLIVGANASTTETHGITIVCGNAATNGGIAFSDGSNGGQDAYRGMISYQHNDNHMQFRTNATERLRIDSSGNVTKPTNFHILVDRSSNQTGYSATYPGDVIAWNRIQTGQSSTGASNHFNTSTGIFTAPVTGLYHFHASVNCNFNCEGGWIVLNGSRPNYSTFYPNYTMSADGHLTYRLTAGDEVGLKWYQNGGTNRTINSNALHTWWRIVLLG
tara:strand:+ start:254 stop:1498 length:1245 start_codon:yes stop_codon:yes gene_type:complete